MTKPILHTIPAFTTPAGQAPIHDTTKGTAKGLRPWQVRGFDALRGKALRILISPTGSGKSTLMKALTLDDLDRDPSGKVIIALPQLLIAGSFEVADLVIEGRVRHWESSRRLLDGNQTVESVVSFLRDTPTTPEQRILVCTHQTLVAAHERLLKAAKGSASPWKGVSLYIDETHHSRSADLPDDIDIAQAKKERALQNKLGKVVAHWLDKDPGRLLLATATWMRSNWTDIVPRSRWDDFQVFTFAMEEFLASMQHLREVSFRFVIGDVKKCLQALYEEGNPRSILYLPPVQSPYIQAKGGKVLALHHYLGGIGKQTPCDDWTAYRHFNGKTRSDKIRWLDLVREEDRDDRKSKFQAAIRGEGVTPDLVCALNLGKEGFDWPELARSIVIGERASIPDVLQMLGRLLRDHPGKSKVEFNMVLPYDGKGGGDQVRDYMKVVLQSMVVEWQFYQRDTLGAAKEQDILDSLRNKPEQAAKVIGAIVDEAIQNSGTHSDDKVIEDGVKRSGVMKDEPVDVQQALARRLKRLFSDRTKAMIQSAGDVAVDLGVNESEVFGCLRMVGAVFGHKTLQEIREAVGTKPDLTEEQIREWAEEHKARTGKWPSEKGGDVAAALHKETWSGVDLSLRTGLRGLRGGSSLSQLLSGKRLQKKNRSPITEDQIVEASENWKKSSGEWPTRKSGWCAEIGRTWGAIDRALWQGCGGLVGRSSLARLLEGRGLVVNFKSKNRHLSIEQIATEARDWKRKTGKRPRAKSGYDAVLGRTWRNVDAALSVGYSGLPGGSSLSKLLDEHGIE